MTPKRLHALRLNGRVPAGVILVSMCGKMREPFVEYTKPDDDWRMLHGLPVCVVTNEDGVSDETFDLLNVIRSVEPAALWLLNLTNRRATDVETLSDPCPMSVRVNDRDDLEETLDWIWMLMTPKTGVANA